jgi:phosphoadenosine phosphosulfate reductase
MRQRGEEMTDTTMAWVIDELTIKTRVAIDRLIEHEPTEGYYLAFSGGKDSIVIYDLAVKSGIKFDAHFSMTTVDPDEVRSFIKNNYPGVIWERPKRSMFKMIEDKMMLPTRIIRYCCSELKEIGGRDRVVVTGVRRAESVNRKVRKIFEKSTRFANSWLLHPIVDWSDTDVWDYIKRNNLKYCSLYDEGKTRIGCIMCPMQGTKGMLKDKERFPKYYKAYLRAIDRMLIKLQKLGKRCEHGNTAEEVMHWWIHNKDYDHSSQQQVLSNEVSE